MSAQASAIARLAYATPQFRGKARLFRMAYRLVGADPNQQMVVRLPLGPGGVRINASLASLIESSVMLIGTYEPAESRVIDDSVQHGFHVMDVGANVGLHTLRLAYRAGVEGRVLAFEPVPEFREKLAANLALNGFSNVSVFASAVAAEEGSGIIYVNPPGWANRNATMVCDARSQATPIPVTVPVARIDEVWEKLARPPIRFVKMDIEGYELKALVGAREMIAACKPSVMLEFSLNYSQQMGFTQKDLIDFFSARAPYTVSLVTSSGVTPLLAPPTQPTNTLLFVPRK